MPDITPQIITDRVWGRKKTDGLGARDLRTHPVQSSLHFLFGPHASGTGLCRISSGTHRHRQKKCLAPIGTGKRSSKESLFLSVLALQKENFLGNIFRTRAKHQQNPPMPRGFSRVEGTADLLPCFPAPLCRQHSEVPPYPPRKQAVL